MPQNHLIRPFADFHGRYCRNLMSRWWIYPKDLAREAGVTLRSLELWLSTHLASRNFAGRAAVYDALLTLMVRNAGWAAEEAKRLRAEHDARLRTAAARQGAPEC